MYRHFPIYDLAIKKVKMNPRSSFEQCLQVMITQCYIPSFMAISHLVLEKTIFKGYIHNGQSDHTDHVTGPFEHIFVSINPEGYI